MHDMLHRAASAIQRHLQRDVGYASDLVALLTESELEEIVESDVNNGAVMIAAIIYRVRIRIAEHEANVHHKTIEQTVPIRRRHEAHSCGVEGPAVRQVPQIEEDEKDPALNTEH